MAEQQSEELDIDATVDSLVEDLGFVESPPGGEDSDSTVTLGEAADGKEPPPGTTRGEDGKFAKAAIEGTPAAGGAPAVPAASGDQTVAAPPKSVPVELHAEWAKTPKPVQEFYAKREQDFLNGTEQYRQAATYGQMLHEKIHPYMPYLNSKTYADGRQVPVQDAIAFLLNAEYQLSTGTPDQKAQVFAKLAQDYGVDLAQLPQPEQNIDPAVLALRKEVTTLRSGLTQFQQSQIAGARAELGKQVETFASDPKNLYFDEVADDIVTMINAGLDLPTAYERAVWANPVTRQKEQARLDKERNDSAKVKEAERVKAAKEAKAANLRGKSEGRAPTALPETMDETIANQLAEIKARG